ncbi:MAG: TldD/PmbA family protein [Elusimicrobia bacterium]|nr:TldD/PmbA family protein [Elusimicrobiota bacterium]
MARARWGELGRAAEGLEIYVEESRRRTLRWEDGRLEEAVDASDAGIGLRALAGNVRFASLDARRPLSQGPTSEEARTFHALAQTLVQRKAAVSRRPLLAFAPPTVKPDEAPAQEKVRWLARADRAARRDRRIRQVRLTLGELSKNVAGVTAEGRAFSESRSYVTLVAQVTAADGRQRQSGYEVTAIQGGWNDLLRANPSALAARAARRALAKLAAPAAPLGEMAVVIAAQAGGTLIHEAVGHSLEADSIEDGSSPHYAGKIGRVVAGEKISVLDDPTLPGQRGSFGVDDEGTPSERTVLIENGVLRTYLYDRRTAGAAGRLSNGHGRRESYAHRPIPRMSNTFIAPGPDDPRRILQELKRGLFVTRLGGGQVNTATGDFVFEVEEGFWVEGGRVKNPVRGANLLGNGPDVLRSIDRVGWDLGWSVGTCGKEGQNVPVSDGLPTLRIPRVVVGGAA